MSCVYRLNIENCDDNYIGSCVDLHKRKNGHKHNCFNEKRKDYNKKLYQFIRENYEWNAVSFEVLEQHDEILDNLELRKREQHFIDVLKPTLNSQKAHITAEQRVERDKERKKKHYKENTEYHKERKKKYYEENKSIYTERNKKYYEANIEKIHKKYDCCCKGKYTYQSKSRHLKSKIHQDYLANSNK